GVSARKIASAVGCSATTIYIYYKNIDDLLHHLRMEGFALLTRTLQRAKGASAVERVIEMGKAYFRFGMEHPNYYDLMFLYRFRELPKPEIIQREIYALTLLRDAVKSGIESGEIRNDIDLLVLTNALWAEIHGVTSLAVSGRLWQTAPGQHEKVLDAVFLGMARWLEP
ncbi:MAG: TetR/AcrR family transcriptional regulator, partial [Candidatus Binatia bacterium]